MFIMQFVMITSAGRQSIAHTLFFDPSEDPFLDPYIETVSRMNTKEIMAIPKMDDNEFLQYLLDDDATLRGKSTETRSPNSVTYPAIWRYGVSAGDLLESLNFEICDTILISLNLIVYQCTFL